jgi:malate synthase
LAIGGMTALFPSREDAELNARALQVLEQDKRNEAACFMDGAWTGHPDQNAIAVGQFPAPNQIAARPQGVERYPDLRPAPAGVGRHSLEGTRAAVRTAIRYRNGVLNGRGASLLDGYMEDLATDRIYRLMIAQRMVHRDMIAVTDAAAEAIAHTSETVTRLFDEELARLIEAPTPGRDLGTPETLREARRLSEELIRNSWFDPV